MTNLSSKLHLKLIYLGIYQIAGGCAGVLIVLLSLLIIPATNGLAILLYLLMVLFFLFSIFCGILCIKSGDKALTYSLINQILQIIDIAILGYGFQYAAGVYLTAGIDLTEDFTFKFGLGISKLELNINSEPERLELRFNFVAFFILSFIGNLKKQIKKEEEDELIASVVAK